MPSTTTAGGTAIFGSGQYGAGDLSSHYTVDYKKYDNNSNLRRKMKPQTHLANAPFEGVSTNSQYYAAPPADTTRTQPIRPPHNNFAGTNGPLDSLSSYASTFTGQTMPRVRSMKPPHNRVRNDAPFESSTTSRATYQPWDSQVRKPYRLKSNLSGNLGAAGALDYQTESATQFNDKGFTVRKSLKPARDVARNNGRFEGSSVAHSDFVDWKQGPRGIMRPDNNRQAVSETRDFVSEASRQFGEKDYQAPARSMKPPLKNSAIESGEFNEETTAGSAFVNYDGARPATPAKSATGSTIKHGDEPFQNTTSYGNQFTGQTQARVTSMRPKQTPVTTGNFEASTTYRQSHQPWNQRPAALIKPKASGSSWYLDGVSQGGPECYQTEHALSFNDKGYVARRAFNPKQIQSGIY